MKKTLFFLTAALLVFTAVSAMAVNLGWDDPNPYSVGVQGYRIYWVESDNPGIEKVAEVTGWGNTHVTIDPSNFLYGVSYTFEVTAFNINGESIRSLPLIGIAEEWQNPGQTPAQPGGLHFADTPGILIPPDQISDAQ